MYVCPLSQLCMMFTVFSSVHLCTPVSACARPCTQLLGKPMHTCARPCTPVHGIYASVSQNGAPTEPLHHVPRPALVLPQLVTSILPRGVLSFLKKQTVWHKEESNDIRGMILILIGSSLLYEKDKTKVKIVRYKVRTQWTMIKISSSLRENQRL